MAHYTLQATNVSLPTPPPDAAECVRVAEAWAGEQVLAGYHADTGTWLFLAIHNTVLGPPIGGCRLRVYDSPAAGLRDAQRLAEGMTYKWAGLSMPYGGAKCVIAAGSPLTPEARLAVLDHLGRLLAPQPFGYRGGEDFGTSVQDMVRLAAHAPGVFDAYRAAVPLDASAYTAAGVLGGIRSAVRHRLQRDRLDDLVVVIEGAGGVGSHLASLLRPAGARVLVSDINSARAAEIARRTGAVSISPDPGTAYPCDVYAPCAVGGTLTPANVARLRCSIVAGAANNQLSDDSVAEALRVRGILYAPDFVINGGGALSLGLYEMGIRDGAAVAQATSRIEQHLDEMFTESARMGVSALEVALATCRRRLTPTANTGSAQRDR